MTVLAALLAVAAVCVLGAPRLLRVRSAGVRRPRLLLAAWLAAFLTGAGCLAASVLWSVMLALAARSGPVDVGWAAGVLAWGALAITGGAAALVLTRAEPFRVGRGAAERDLDLLAAACAVRVERLGRAQLLTVRAARPLAFSSTSAGGRIVVTSALVEALTRSELRAVVEHERAHLAGRHDLLLLAARVNRACLPSFAGARAFDQAVQLLVELVADDAAARACGAGTLAGALRTTAALEPNEWAAIRADRLDAVHPVPPRASRRPALLYKL